MSKHVLILSWTKIINVNFLDFLVKIQQWQHYNNLTYRYVTNKSDIASNGLCIKHLGESDVVEAGRRIQDCQLTIVHNQI